MQSDRISRFLTYAFIVLLSGVSRTVADQPSPTPLRVISYNVQFLPGPASFLNRRGNNTYRAKALGEKLSKYDVIGLNETFDPSPRELLLAELKSHWGDDYHVVIHPKPADKYNGGLLIASRYPIVASNHCYYENASRIEDHGVFADGWAAKGVLHARIVRDKSTPNDAIDVFTTHLEARDKSIRELQYPELAAFLRAHQDPRQPALLLGDLNTRGNPDYQKDTDSLYHRLMGKLRSVRPDAPPVDLWIGLGQGIGGTGEPTDIENSSRIDYVILYPPVGAANRLIPKRVAVNAFLDEKVTSLSDHSAVEADFDWK